MSEKKEKKIRVRKIGELEAVKCSECESGIKLSDTFVFCSKKVKVNYANQTCSEGVKGEAVLYEEDLEKIIDLYMSNKEMIEFLKETNEAIKNLLINEIVSKSEMIGKYRVTIIEYEQERLDVKKAREQLKEWGILEQFISKTKVIYPRIKRL